MTIALLIIDIQQVLCTGQNAAFESDRVIDRINLVMARGRAAQAPVLLIQHEADNTPLAYGSPGWKLAEGLNATRTDAYIRKTAADSFHNTDLRETLEKQNVEHLIICGLQSDFCVDTTTRRALALGYSVTLVSDGHSTIDNDILSAAQITAHHTATLANITSFGSRVTPLTAAKIRFGE